MGRDRSDAVHGRRSQLLDDIFGDLGDEFRVERIGRVGFIKGCRDSLVDRLVLLTVFCSVFGHRDIASVP